MDFAPSQRVEELSGRIRDFLDEHVYPVELDALKALDEEVGPGVPYPRILVELRERAKADGLWNLFLPDEEYGPGLTNWEYGMLCEEMGRSQVAPMAFNCSAPRCSCTRAVTTRRSARRRTRTGSSSVAARVG